MTENDTSELATQSQTLDCIESHIAVHIGQWKAGEISCPWQQQTIVQTLERLPYVEVLRVKPVKCNDWSVFAAPVTARGNVLPTIRYVKNRFIDQAYFNRITQTYPASAVAMSLTVGAFRCRIRLPIVMKFLM